MRIVQWVNKNKVLSIVFLVYVYLFLTNKSQADVAINNSRFYIIEMLEIMPVILMLTAIIDTWIPKQVIINHFGETSGLKGQMLALLLGSISAGPIYAAFPVCKMLLKKGASIRNIVIILSAWAVVKVPMLANEAKFLGGKFMILRWLLTVVAIYFMAYAMDRLLKQKDIAQVNKIEDKAGKALQVDVAYCVGCGLCEKSLPEYFQMINGKAKCITQNIKEQDLDQIKEMVTACPAKAINYAL